MYSLRYLAAAAVSTVFRTSDLEKFYPVCLSKIARVLLIRPITPMLMYPEAAAPDAIALRIIDCFRRWIIGQRRFAQVVVGVRDIGKVRPFGSEEVEADRIDRYAVK